MSVMPKLEVAAAGVEWVAWLEVVVGERVEGGAGYVARETDRRMIHTGTQTGDGLDGHHVPDALASLH